MVQGDALKALPEVLAATPDPVCIYHSACLAYWSDAGKAALHAFLEQASRSRTLYRVSVESRDDVAKAWATGQWGAMDAPTPYKRAEGAVTVTRYDGGRADSRVIGYAPWEYYLREGEPFHWLT